MFAHGQASAHLAALGHQVTSPPKRSQIPCISCLAELARLSLERGLWLGPGRAGAGEAPCPQSQLPAPLRSPRHPAHLRLVPAQGRTRLSLPEQSLQGQGVPGRLGQRWAVPVLPHGDAAACPGSTAAPCRPGKLLLPAPLLPTAPSQRARLPVCFEGASPELQHSSPRPARHRG